MPWVARAGDRGHFLTLAMEFLETSYPKHDDLPPTTANRDAFNRFFSRVVSDPDSGVLVLDQHGFSLALSAPSLFVSRRGKVAAGVGTYVRPEARREGIATAIRQLLVSTLRDRGFDTLMGTVHIANDPAIESLDSFGAEFTHAVCYLDLRKDD